MASITRGRSRVCRDSIGGIHKFYIFPYVNYSDSQITVLGNSLTDFPDTTIYEFFLNNNSGVSESMKNEDGLKSVTQNISIELQGLEDSYEIEKFTKKDYRIIVEDRNGNIKILGTYNGLSADSLNSTTGGGKGSFSGHKLSFQGLEEDYSFFIDNLSDVGFTINGQTPVSDFNRITQSGELRITQKTDNRITQNG